MRAFPIDILLHTSAKYFIVWVGNNRVLLKRAEVDY